MLPFINAALLTFILSNAAVLHYNYFAKYEDSHARLIREQERQYEVTVSQNAQHTVQLQADALRLAYLQEHERHKRTSKLCQDLKMEYTLFATTLQRLDPVAYTRTIQALTYVPPKPGKEKK